MPAQKKYDEETQARAVRMFTDRMTESGVSQLAARKEVGKLLGIKEATLRNWIRRDLGEGSTPAVGENASDELVQLRKENARLRPPIESGQYTSLAFTEAMVDAGITGSIGTVGDALDNALMESACSRPRSSTTRTTSGPAGATSRKPRRPGSTGTTMSARTPPSETSHRPSWSSRTTI